MNCCDHCKYLFIDNSTDCYECKRDDDFADWEWEFYEDHGYVPDCPYYEPDDNLKWEDCR